MHIKHVLPGALFCALVLGQVAVCGGVRTFQIPEFNDRQWQEEKSERVWVAADVREIWIELEFIREWVAPTTKPVWVPPAHITIPATYREEWVGPVGHNVDHPAEMGTRTIPAEGYTQHTDATTIEHPERSHEEPNPDIEYDYWVEDIQIEFGYLGSYWDDEWEEWVDEYGFYTVDYGWWEHGTRSGGTHTVTDERAWTEEIPAHDDWVETSPARNEDYEVRGPWSEWVEDSAGHYVTILASPEHEEEVSPGHWAEEEDKPGYWLTSPKPGTGIWFPVEFSPGHWEDLTTPGHWIDVLMPWSTLTVSDNGQEFDGLTWSLGYAVGLPSWVDEMLHDPNWNEPEEDDEDSGNAFTPALAFAFSGVWQEAIDRVQQKYPHRTGTGKVELERPNRTLSQDEIWDSIALCILVAAEEMTSRRTNPKTLMYYITYTKKGPGGLFYSGRTSGWGDADAAEQVIARREVKHRVDWPEYEPAIPATIIITVGWAYEAWAATRDREQQTMDYYDWKWQVPGTYTLALSHSTNAQPTLTRPNGTRGVAKHNPRSWDYHDVAARCFYFTVLWGYTGEMGPLDPIPWPPLPPAYLLIRPFVRPMFDPL